MFSNVAGMIMECSLHPSFFYAELLFSHAKFNSRIRGIFPSDAFLSWSCIYFSLLFAYVKWVLTGTIRPWQCYRRKCKEDRADYFSPWGLPFGLQAVLLKIAPLCLMLLLSQVQFPTQLSMSEVKSLLKSSRDAASPLSSVQISSFHKAVWQGFVGFCFAWFLCFWSCLSYKRKSWGQVAGESGIYAYKTDILIP